MAATNRKKQISTTNDKALSLVLAYNVAPHPMLDKYHQNQKHRLQIRNKVLCRTEKQRDQNGQERIVQVVRDNVTCYIDDDGKVKYYFDEQEADRWINWIQTFCTHAKARWTGDPLILNPWQKWILREFFGWRKLGTKLRRYKYLFLFLPRKNGKSLLIAALALGLMLIDGEKTPEIYATASTDEQAGKLFEMALAMIKQNPELESRLQGFKGNITYKDERTGYFRPIAFNPDAFHGANPSVLILDEYHVQKTTGMKRVGETGMGARDQPIVAIVSTAANERATPCEKEFYYACNIRDGVIEKDNYLPCIFQAVIPDGPEGAETWMDIQTAIDCNPNYPDSPSHDFLVDELEKALADPLVALEYKQLQLNIFIEKRQIWLPYDVWLKGKTKFDFRQFRGEKLYWGCDLGSEDDLTALVLVKPGGLFEGDWYVHAHFWCPKNTVIAKRNYLSYQIWQDKGFLEVTPGNATNYSRIKERIKAYSEYFNLDLGNMDRFNATWLASLINDEDNIKTEFMGQGTASMTEPIKYLITLAKSGRLKHNTPILDWMANNTVSDGDWRAVKFDKADEDSKIDGMVALAMAVSGALRNLSAPKESSGIWIG